MNRKHLRTIIILCIVAIIAISAIPGCSVPSSILCTAIACIMANCMDKAEKTRKSESTNQ